MQLLWESNIKLVANVKSFSAWKLAIGDDWKHPQRASTEIKECLLNIQDLWTFQNKLSVCLPQAIFSGPCWLKPWSFFIPTFSTPAKSLLILLPKDFHLSQLSHFQAWLAVQHSPLDSPFSIHFPNINSRHLGARTAPGPLTIHVNVPWVCFWLSGSRVHIQLPSPLPGHTAFTCPRHCVKICHFFKKLKLVSIWEFCSADKGKAVTRNRLLFPSALHQRFPHSNS